MRHFKLPLIITGITLLLALIFGLTAITLIHRSQISRRQKEERAQKLGGATALGTLLIITPFWLIASAKVGKERREARAQAQARESAVE
jgi:hypothetical protein